MNTIADCLPDETRQPKTIRTTLYDLIEALNDEVKPEEADLVVPVIMHLLRTGRITFPGQNVEHVN